jgi:hypothetical protein
MKKILRFFWSYCISKGKNEGLIIGMPYVVLFSMWMTMQKWHLVYLKSCVNNFMLCYSNPMFFFNPRMKLKKGLVFNYKKWNNIHEKTCWCKTIRKFEKFWTWINFAMKRCLEKQPIKKRQIYRFIHFLFFVSKDPFKKMMWTKLFLENLTFLVVKNHLCLQFVKNAWLKHLIFALMSLSLVFFTKVIFTWCFASPNGENQMDICFASPWKMPFSHY